MGLRTAIRRMLAKGSEPEHGDDLRELVTVPLFEGPLLVADLQGHGIEATSVETYNVVTNVVSDVRILVRGTDLDAAQAVLASRSLDEGDEPGAVPDPP